jgi:hypothetical protein
MGAGLLIVVPVIGVSNPQPSVFPNKETINEMCYIDGYSAAAKWENFTSALCGSLVGFLAIGLIITAP